MRDHMTVSRRSFIVTSAGLVWFDSFQSRRSQAQGSEKALGKEALTAMNVVDRIKANVGIPWRTETVDNIVAGAPETRVRSIATTMMATLDVLKRAHAAGFNMIITHESTFFSHEDRTDDLRRDDTFRFKADFIKQNDLVVFHFHDHWHFRQPDGIFAGMARELGWEKNLVATSSIPTGQPGKAEGLFSFPGITLAALSRQMQSRLRIRTMRVMGDPNMRVGRALASWGHLSLMPGVPYLARPDVDVLIVGETREWELVEYVQDQIASGKKKALIVLGHVVSEQAGMKYCADWLKPFIPEVPIGFVAATEPFWRPDAPVSPGEQ
jgi:putative NIF3 family GTP cyclohydrolase 1 type 2